MDNNFETEVEEENFNTSWDFLKQRIMVLNEQWENRVDWPLVERWFSNFNGATGEHAEVEKIHALYLLSQFMYFGNREIRVLLRALYRDLFYLPLIQEIRNNNGGTRNHDLLNRLVQHELYDTRFLGVGNPSESGVYMLYFFRQVNGLSRDNFMDGARIIKRVSEPNGKVSRVPRYPNIRRFVFLDDICGSGQTAIDYSHDLLEELLDVSPDARLYYFSLFATKDGLKRVRDESLFKENCGAVFELDSTYRCLEADSRYLKITPPGIDPSIVTKVARVYGEKIFPGHGGGYENSQMLLGFHHNTPDNTIPIIWMDEQNDEQNGSKWIPVFKRYPKN